MPDKKLTIIPLKDSVVQIIPDDYATFVKLTNYMKVQNVPSVQMNTSVFIHKKYTDTIHKFNSES